MKARRSLLVLLIFVLAVVGAGSLWVWQAKRQYVLNRQLIAALVNHDTRQALALVNAGANPNTREKASPPPTLPQLFRQLLHRSPPVVNDSPTALHLASGDVVAYWLREDSTAPLPLDDVPLVQDMLVHGADVRATDEDGHTALHYAISWNHPHSAQLLVDSGANVNAPDINGMTPLMIATGVKDVDTTRFLLEHGASVTLTNKWGDTALYYAILYSSNTRIVAMLLAHGADANARDRYGNTPLRLAQRQQRPDLVRLLRGKR